MSKTKELTVHKKLLVALYACRQNSTDYLVRKWCQDWLAGRDRTPETAFTMSQKGRTIAGKLGQAAYNLARIEDDPSNENIYLQIANDCLELAVTWLKENKDSEFSYLKYLGKVREFKEYIPASDTRKSLCNNLRYGKRKLSKEEYNLFYEEQEGKCWICERKADEVGHVNSHKKKYLVVDHDSSNPKESKNIRGLLCPMCNTGLGMFQDNPKLLEDAAFYLKFFTPERQR